MCGYPISLVPWFFNFKLHSFPCYSHSFKGKRINLKCFNMRKDKRADIHDMKFLNFVKRIILQLKSRLQLKEAVWFQSPVNNMKKILLKTWLRIEYLLSISQLVDFHLKQIDLFLWQIKLKMDEKINGLMKVSLTFFVTHFMKFTIYIVHENYCLYSFHIRNFRQLWRENFDNLKLK